MQLPQQLRRAGFDVQFPGIEYVSDNYSIWTKKDELTPACCSFLTVYLLFTFLFSRGKRFLLRRVLLVFRDYCIVSRIRYCVMLIIRKHIIYFHSDYTIFIITPPTDMCEKSYKFEDEISTFFPVLKVAQYSVLKKLSTKSDDAIGICF